MKYIKKYSLFENNEFGLKLISKEVSELREDSISISVEDTNVGYDFIINKDKQAIEVIYDFEPDSFIESMGINDDGTLKDSELKKWLVSLNESSIGISKEIDDSILKVEKFENIDLLKKGIVKVEYNNKIITLLIEESDIDTDDIIKFNTEKDKLTADQIGFNLDEKMVESVLDLYYQ